MKLKDLYDRFITAKQISTDTRNITKGAVFFALKGENFNANEFADQAIENGASCVVIDDESFYKNEKKYFLVDDVLQTLQDLASYHRQELGIPIIALTGSNGKTTTKELIKTVLSIKFRITATKGNLNNHIGVPLTLLSMDENTEIGVVEMGANHFGEITKLCEIAKPNYGYITNFGKAHLEGFGSLEGVVKAKTELYNFLKKSNGTVFVNSKDQKQISLTNDLKRVLLGSDIKQIESNEFVKVQVGKTLINSHLIGDYNFLNISAAIGIGDFFDVSKIAIKTAIESYVPKNKRSQIIKKGTTQIILDAYNANPTSMQAAITSFAKHTSSNKVLILGDMFELGNSSKEEHQEIAELANSFDFGKVYLLGENFYQTKDTKALKFKSFQDFISTFKKADFKETTLLIKASRGMALERIIDLFN